MTNHFEVPTTDEQEADSVELIAAGYEWVCPACESLNHEIEVTEKVTCRECGREYATDAPEHAYS